MSQKVGVALREARARQGITQVDLSKKAKVSQAYIARLEGGDKKNPSLAVVQRLAKALGVPIGELLQ